MARRFLQQPRGPQAEVGRFGYASQRVRTNNAPVIGNTEAQLISVIEELKCSLQKMQAIGATPDDMQKQIDLRRCRPDHVKGRSEEHTSELQSRGLISYAVFCLKKKK